MFILVAILGFSSLAYVCFCLLVAEMTASDINVKPRPAIIYSVVLAFESRKGLHSVFVFDARAVH